jgi:uncharacterized protein YndB with AHSA1/START domain
MQSVIHTFHINKSQEEVYQALTTIDGLSSWWTTDTIGSTALGDSIYFTFGGFATFEFQVALLDPGKLVSWKFLSGNPDWTNTYVTMVLSAEEGKTKVEFVHDGFQEDYASFGNINFTWGGYLSSLRDYCETGKGQPFSE